MSAPPDPPALELDASVAERWTIVNDGVMGGRSDSRIAFDASGARFEGNVSLANGGGFASARTDVEPLDLSAWDGLELRAEGQGKTFQLRLRTDRERDGVAYRARFRAPAGAVDRVRIPWASFRAVRRGHELPDAPPPDRARIVQIGFLIADGQPGPFRLHVESVRAYREGDADSR